MTSFARIALASSSSSGPRAAFARVEGASLYLLARAPWDGLEETGERLVAAGARLLAPALPTKIVCVGRNYRAHARELGHEAPTEPLLFFKPPSSLAGPGDAIHLPAASARVDHEAELGVIIGRRCWRASEADALSFVAGYTCVNDVTARDLQKKDGQWARAKGFDSFCPSGPYLVTDLDPQSLSIRCRVNGELRQEGHTRDMIFPVAALIAYISAIMTLEPGDLLATGTPEGVGPLTHGDVVEVDIAGIGSLRNSAATAEAR